MNSVQLFAASALSDGGYRLLLACSKLCYRRGFAQYCSLMHSMGSCCLVV